MDHPVLHVKKGSVVYDDTNPEESLARMDAGKARRRSEPPPPRPRARRGRGLSGRGVLIAVLVLVVAAIVILRILPGSGPRANIDGWHAFLQARPSGSGLFVGVAFSRLPHVFGGTDSGQVEASITFFLPATGERLVVSGLLSGSRAVLRGTMPYTSAARVLEADVRIGEKSKRLVLNISAP